MLAASRGLDGGNAPSPAGNAPKVMSPGGNVEMAASPGGAVPAPASSDLIAAAVAEEVRPKHLDLSRIRTHSKGDERNIAPADVRRRAHVTTGHLVLPGKQCL
jgi:hypothetical protein